MSDSTHQLRDRCLPHTLLRPHFNIQNLYVQLIKAPNLMYPEFCQGINPSPAQAYSKLGRGRQQGQR